MNFDESLIYSWSGHPTSSLYQIWRESDKVKILGTFWNFVNFWIYFLWNFQNKNLKKSSPSNRSLHHYLKLQKHLMETVGGVGFQSLEIQHFKKFISSIEWCGVPRRCNNQYGKCPCPDWPFSCPWAAYHLPYTGTPTHGDGSIRFELVWIGAAVAEIWLPQNTVSTHKWAAHLAAHGQPITCPTLE